MSNILFPKLAASLGGGEEERLLVVGEGHLGGSKKTMQRGKYGPAQNCAYEQELGESFRKNKQTNKAG